MRLLIYTGNARSPDAPRPLPSFHLHSTFCICSLTPFHFTSTLSDVHSLISTYIQLHSTLFFIFHPLFVMYTFSVPFRSSFLPRAFHFIHFLLMSTHLLPLKSGFLPLFSFHPLSAESTHPVLLKSSFLIYVFHFHPLFANVHSPTSTQIRFSSTGFHFHPLFLLMSTSPSST